VPAPGSTCGVGGDLHVVGEHDRPVGQLGLVDGFERAHALRLPVDGLGRLVGELEEMHEPGRVVLLLPGGVDAAARLAGGDVLHELDDGGLDGLHRRLTVLTESSGRSRSPVWPSSRTLSPISGASWPAKDDEAPSQARR
jgi:hypothetical protein